MEVAAGYRVVVIGEYYRVIRNGIYFPGNCRADVFYRVAARAVYLRHAANGVCVLNLALLHGGAKAAALCQLSYVRGAVHLPPVAAQLMHLRVKRLGYAKLCLRGHCGGNIGGFCKLHRAVKRMQSRACHNLRAVYKRKALLRRKLHRGYARPRHCFRAAHAFAVIHGLALAYHNQHHVRKGRKVSARAKAALLRYYGMHMRV